MTDKDFFRPILEIEEVRSPRGSPSGEHILSLSNRQGSLDIYNSDIESYESTRVVNVPDEMRIASQAQLIWGPTDDHFYFSMGTDRTQPDLYQGSLDKGAKPLVTANGRIYPWDVGPDGRFVFYQQLTDDDWSLLRYDRKTNRSEHITKYKQIVHKGAGGCSPTGDHIAYNMTTARQYDQCNIHLAHFDGKDSQTLPLGDNRSDAVTLARAWHPDGKQLLIWDKDAAECGVFDLRDWSVEWINTDESLTPVTFFHDGERILATNSKRNPVILDRTGVLRKISIERVAHFDPVVTDGAICGEDNDQLLFLLLPTGTRPIEIGLYNLTTDTFDKVGGISFEQIGGQENLVRPDEFTYPGANEEELSGLRYDSGQRPTPVVVDISPYSGSGFRRDTQMLVREGYTVIHPTTTDPRALPNPDYAAVGRWLRQQDWVAEDEIALYGHSYGGMNAHWQMVTTPEIWDAAIASAAPTDLLTWHEESAQGPLPIYRNNGHPNENEERWRERSPITSIDGFSGPLLIIHGAGERTVPVSQARSYREKLHEKGYIEGDDFEYVELEKPGHWIGDIPDRIERWSAILDFLDRRL